jgi:hypothetical protein
MRNVSRIYSWLGRADADLGRERFGDIAMATQLSTTFIMPLSNPLRVNLDPTIPQE